MDNTLQTLFDRCETQRARLLKLADGRSDAELEYRRRPATWSMAQELHHLALSEQEIARRAASPDKAARQAREFRQAHRGVPFPLALLILRCGIPVPVPLESVLPRSDATVGEVEALWTRARTELRERLESRAGEPVGQPFAVHPICGPLSAEQVLRFLLAHGDYHGRHLRRLCADLDR